MVRSCLLLGSFCAAGLLVAAGCGDVSLQNGAYVCSADRDCDNGWKCLARSDGKNACYAPDLACEADLHCPDGMTCSEQTKACTWRTNIWSATLDKKAQWCLVKFNDKGIARLESNGALTLVHKSSDAPTGTYVMMRDPAPKAGSSPKAPNLFDVKNNCDCGQLAGRCLLSLVPAQPTTGGKAIDVQLSGNVVFYRERHRLFGAQVTMAAVQVDASPSSAITEFKTFDIKTRAKTTDSSWANEAIVCNQRIVSLCDAAKTPKKLPRCDTVTLVSQDPTRFSDITVQADTKQEIRLWVSTDSNGTCNPLTGNSTETNVGLYSRHTSLPSVWSYTVTATGR